MSQAKRWALLTALVLVIACSRAAAPTSTMQNTRRSPVSTMIAQPPLVPSVSPATVSPPLPVNTPSAVLIPPTPPTSPPTPTSPLPPTPSSTATPRAGTPAPPPEPPRIPVTTPFTHRVVENFLIIQLDPNGGTQTWDAFDLAARIGYSQQPPCAAFGLALAWQIIVPYPTPPDLQFSLSGTRQGVTTPLGSGPNGVARIGCATVTFSNQSPYLVRVRLRVAVDVASPY